MSNGKPISSSDPQAVEKLTVKLETCRDLQNKMKEVNAYWRRNATCAGAPGITAAEALKLDERINNAQYRWELAPYTDYTLRGNYEEIRRLEKRIAEITRNREVGFSGWEFKGGKAVVNTELNRLQLLFDEKPGEDIRANLKANGFKWAPSQEAWQRQLTDNAIYAAGRLPFIKPLDGRSVRDHQPKAPLRNAATR